MVQHPLITEHSRNTLNAARSDQPGLSTDLAQLNSTSPPDPQQDWQVKARLVHRLYWNTLNELPVKSVAEVWDWAREREEVEMDKEMKKGEKDTDLREKRLTN